jgi:RNA polymerase sigma factor (sigma-70 family)
MKHLHNLAGEIEKAIHAEGRLAHQILRTIWSVVRRFGFQLEDAKDIVHETLSVLLMKVQNQEFRGHASLGTFAYQITKNLCLKRLKKLTCRKRGGDATHIPINNYVANTLQADPLHSNPLEILKKKESEHLVKQCIEALKHKEAREVLTLLLKGHPRHEISNLLNIPVKRVDAAISYGKKKLIKSMQKKT